MDTVQLKTEDKDIHSVTVDESNYKAINGIIEANKKHLNSLLIHGFKIHIPELIEEPIIKAKVKGKK